MMKNIHCLESKHIPQKLLSQLSFLVLYGSLPSGQKLRSPLTTKSEVGSYVSVKICTSLNSTVV